ncbi:hypothetical protein OsccyDRAFT_2821 [Leptolyngbyaceae cyanobacterium JSC-12]|nr:hypothetical protein OsccyDRAFT_2821 [Leptolyngbyaceae cyanobacterium JSC-12]
MYVESFDFDEILMNFSSLVYTSDINSHTIDDRAVRKNIECISMERGEAPMDKKADKKLVSFRLPEDLLQGLRGKADYYGISVTELVCRLLRQGLEEDGGDRIKTLEAEIRDLRQRLRQANSSNGVTHTLLYPVQTQATVPYSNSSGLEQRMERLEAMLEVLADRINFQESGKRGEDDS